MEYKEENLLSQDGYGGGSSNSKTPFLDRSRVRILLCDNDVKSSEEVFTLLCNCSYQVTSVRTARQVIDALNAEGPDIDIILTEVDIPIAKGLKLLKYIMRDQELRRIPIIMMSAQDEVSVVVKCLRLGAADYLVKPLRTNELLNLWTHMWRRRHMLGLTEKNIMNFDFDLVGSDPSDANTNSTTLFSDDTDDKSRRSAIPEMSVSNHQENESNANASVEPPWKNLLEYHPDVPAISDRRTGQISSFPKKSELKVGESSAFFTYVKSSLPTNNSQKVGYLDENAAPHLESSSREKIIPAWCKQVADDAEGRENSGVLQSYSRGYGFPSSDNAPDSTSVERSCTPLVPLEFQNGRNLKEEQLSTVVVHPSNQSQPDVSGVPSLTPLPYYSSGMMNQIMMPSSAQLYQRNLHDFPQYTTSAMLPQYNHLSQCPRLPMMTSFPYYPFNIYMQPGQMPATHMWPSIGSSSSPEVKTGRVERREAALIKFRFPPSPNDLRSSALIMSSSSSVVSNGGSTAGKPSPASVPLRFASVYSEVQKNRLNHPLPLPNVLKNLFKIVEGPPSSAAGNPDEIAKLFPNMFGQPSSMLVPNDSAVSGPDKNLKIGVVLSGGQAPGGHNVISGIFDYLQDFAKGSTVYGFKGGPAGIMKCKYVELTSDYIYPYRNQGGFDMIHSGRDKIETPEQFKQAEETALKLDLDGLVVIGGDDSNTNACLLAENFRAKNMKTRVIGCPKTIDGDLKCKEVPISFGFDTACKIYAEMIGNVMTDARSTGKYYHFVRLMGRAASHITLECALQTHPNITIIGEEVAAKKLTLKNVTDYITDVICKRAELGYNYGVILIPEGLIDFIPEVQQLIAELNEILAHDVVDEDGLWKKKLRHQSQLLFEFLPKEIQEQLMLERDPHGNVQVAKIETEKMLIQMVETELEKRKQEGVYNRQFKGQSHFFGYEGRCGLPTNFDSIYCYALGYGAGALLHCGKTGLISSVGNLSAPVEEWTVGGTALTSLMDVERRHGKFKPVLKKAMVELEGAPFKKFASMRDEWAFENRYFSPGPIQFIGPASNNLSHTLLLELGAQA